MCVCKYTEHPVTLFMFSLLVDMGYHIITRVFFNELLCNASSSVMHALLSLSNRNEVLRITYVRMYTYEQRALINDVIMKTCVMDETLGKDNTSGSVCSLFSLNDIHSTSAASTNVSRNNEYESLMDLHCNTCSHR